jgi:hypothetical protein
LVSTAIIRRGLDKSFPESHPNYVSSENPELAQTTRREDETEPAFPAGSTPFAVLPQ